MTKWGKIKLVIKNIVLCKLVACKNNLAVRDTAFVPLVGWGVKSGEGKVQCMF